MLSEDEVKAEWLKCNQSFLYFINEYVWIYNATVRAWVPFKMWRYQAWTLKHVHDHKMTVILKARQLGLTWLALAFMLWLMLFRSAAAIGIFSKREEEAIDLLDNRLKGMYQRLPDWLKSREVNADSKKFWSLSNGSWVRAFPTTAGDSYTFTFVLVDEADLADNLGNLLSAVKPTIDAGGWMMMLSRVDKGKPRSTFKAIYRAAKQGQNDWFPIFLPWNSRPDRDEGWYQRQVQDSLSMDGTMDYVYEQYPATDVEALAAKSMDKRLPPGWLLRCYEEMAAALPTPGPFLKEGGMVGAPTMPGLQIFKWPEAGNSYVVAADPAEGNPNSDPSALVVLSAVNGEEVASGAARIEPTQFAGYVAAVARFYNQALVGVERNNHGHTVIAWLKEHAMWCKLVPGLDGRPGWQTNSVSKAMLYDALAEGLRDGMCVIHSFATYTQLSGIEGSTLSAPDGEYDDLAMAFAMCFWAASGRGPYAILEFYRKQAEALAKAANPPTPALPIPALSTAPPLPEGRGEKGVIENA